LETGIQQQFTEYYAHVFEKWLEFSKEKSMYGLGFPEQLSKHELGRYPFESKPWMEGNIQFP
jgi:hypothetical protein